jgi:hypothetical protein
MARPVEPRSGGIGGRLLLGIVVLIVLWVVLRVVLGLVYSVVRAALFVGLFAVVAWVVLVGPPGDRD